jgi:hypothetical protein
MEEKFGGKNKTSLLNEWLQFVNQPVVHEVCCSIKTLLETISDNGNFDETRCKQILTEIVKNKP